MKKLLAMVAIASLALLASCGEKAKEQARALALETTSTGMGAVVSTALTCEDEVGVKGYLKEELAKWKIFKPSTEGGVVIGNVTDKSVIGKTICLVASETLHGMLKDEAVKATLLQRGKCSLESVSKLTEGFLLDQCRKIKF